MKHASRFVVPALLACAFQVCAAQSPIRVCTAEARLWSDRVAPKSLPPILPPAGAAGRPKTVLVRLKPLRKQEDVSAMRAQSARHRCDYVVLSWWKWAGADPDRGPGNWTDTTISTPQERAPDDPAPSIDPWDHTFESVPQFPAPPAAGLWARCYELDTAKLDRITTSYYLYSTTKGPKPKTIAEQIGNNIVHLLKARPRR